MSTKIGLCRHGPPRLLADVWLFSAPSHPLNNVLRDQPEVSHRRGVGAVVERLTRCAGGAAGAALPRFRAYYNSPRACFATRQASD